MRLLADAETVRDLVLVADDDLMIRKMIIKVLEREGFRVEEARDGAEAIEHLRDREYRVVLLDMMMPRIDGLAVLDWLRQHRPEQIARVIVLTAFTRKVAESAEAQCAVIYKPFDLQELVEKVRSCASGHEPCATPSQATPPAPLT